MAAAKNSRVLRIIPLMFSVALFCPLTYGKIIHVNDDATGANNGTSWEDAYVYLQDALVDANKAKKPVEIRVAQGIYKPNQGSNQTPYDRKATFQLINDVVLKGGYAGLGELDPNAREVANYETVLSGDLVGDDVEIAVTRDLSDEASRDDNSYHVVTGSGTDVTTMLDGFTITGGNTAGSSYDIHGGGMFNKTGSPSITNCTFSLNSTSWDGGGMSNRNSSPILINCTFIGNSARYGAGMHNYKSSPMVTNCTFTGNKAENGGGMYNEYTSHSILTNCTFSRNIAKVGNALTCDASNHIKWHSSIIDLRNCILWDGGNEIYNNDSSTINITYSNVPNNQTAIYDPGEDVIWGEGNINTDPLFVDADGDDNIVGTEDDDLRLFEGSPCIDAGDNSAVPPSVVTDVEGNPRITNGRVDMGAYERPAKYFLLSTWPLSVPEGSTTEFTVALAEPPSETVEVTVAHYSGDQDITVESGGLLSFDTSNYSVPQTFTLSAAEDSDNLNGMARIRISTPNLFADIKVTESDNEPYVGVLFVDNDATGNNNGSNWTDAYTNLQDALNSSANIGVQEIRIAKGIYRPDQGSGNIPGDRTATFQLINGVVIKGGFAGVSEVDPDIRDIEIYETILSGDLADNDFDVNDPVVLSYEPTRIDNSYHVVTSSGTDSTAVLDGVTISGGNATSLLEYGGGMYNIAGSPTISNCTFIRNWAWHGGGMHNSNSSPTLTNCTFSLNSGFRGGGMYNSNSSHPNLTNCLFTHNSTTIPPGVIVERSVDSGGGMYNYHSNPTLANCTFSGNSSRYGGGIYNYDSHLIVTNCILWNGGNEIHNYASTVTITYSNIQGGFQGEGNIDADPLFLGYWHGNDTPDDSSDDYWVNGDYHLKSQAGRYDPNAQTWVIDDVTSPCIDAGDPNSPVALEPFPNGGIINMGAYGGTSEASKSP